MFRSGAFVADHVHPTDEAQVQPNGVDLTLEAVLEPAAVGRIGREGKTVAERRELDAEADGDAYRLDPGGYVVRYAETVAIPREHLGVLLPRSSLLRNGATLETAVWDAGYEGKGEGLLAVHHPIELEREARVGQLLLASADHEGVYGGSYQGERLE